MNTEKRMEEKRKPLLDPNQPREDVTETGGEYAGKYTADKGPGIVSPGPGTQADGQTTHE